MIRKRRYAINEIMTKTLESESRHLTTRKAAELLGVSLRSVQLWAERGHLEFWKTGGGHRRITRDSVERFMRVRQQLGADALPVEEPPARRLEILVVEDEPTLLRLYRLKIASWPMNPRVEVARNGFEALLRIGVHRPDLLITDLYMPEMDGLQMLRMLQAKPEMQSMGIAVVTSLTPEEIAERGGLPAGIPVFHKPIPFASLEALARQKAGELGLMPHDAALPA